MPDAPAWIELLGAIARGQARGAQLLETWAQQTADPELATVLQRIALRERHHVTCFRARLEALGLTLPDRPDPQFAQRLARARHAASDRERFETLLGFCAATVQAPARDGLERLLEDTRIDAQTGALLGRFIAEERDSQRQLRAQYRRLLEARGSAAPVATSGPGAAQPAPTARARAPRAAAGCGSRPDAERPRSGQRRADTVSQSPGRDAFAPDGASPGAVSNAGPNAVPSEPPAGSSAGASAVSEDTQDNSRDDARRAVSESAGERAGTRAGEKAGSTVGNRVGSTDDSAGPAEPAAGPAAGTATGPAAGARDPGAPAPGERESVSESVQPADPPGISAASKAGASAAALAARPAEHGAAGAARDASAAPTAEPGRTAELSLSDARLMRLRAFLDPVASG